MPKKKAGMTPEEQKKRFIADAERMIADGSLSPIEAQKRVDATLKGHAKLRS